MDIAALVIAALGLLMLFSQRKRLAALESWVDEQRRSTTIKGADSEDEQKSVEGLRKLVAMMAAGKPVDATMVKENRLYRQAKPEHVQADLESGAQLAVVDVRSPQEWAVGHIEGALHIPVDDVSKRLGETGTNFYLPAYTLLRLLASYEITKNWSVSAEANNVTDKEYYPASFAALWVIPGAPRQFQLRTSYKF